MTPKRRTYQRDGHNRRLPLDYMWSAPVKIQQKLVMQAIELSALGFELSELCIIDTPGPEGPEVVPLPPASLTGESE